MSISNITGTAGASQPWQSLVQQRRQDFGSLAQALQSGDLAGAQKAYADLQSLQPNGQAGSNMSNNPIKDDFAALGQALASGNLSQAQTDFAKLQSDFKSAMQTAAQQIGGLARRHHHHREAIERSQNSNSATGATTANGSQPSSSTPGASVNVLA